MDQEIKQGATMFYIGTCEEQAKAYLRWSEQPDRILKAESTFTDPSMRGMGVASRLFEAFVDYARKGGYKIIPACSYVAARMDQEPENYGDLKA